MWTRLETIYEEPDVEPLTPTLEVVLDEGFEPEMIVAKRKSIQKIVVAARRRSETELFGNGRNNVRNQEGSYRRRRQSMIGFDRNRANNSTSSQANSGNMQFTRRSETTEMLAFLYQCTMLNYFFRKQSQGCLQHRNLHGIFMNSCFVDTKSH